MKAKIFSSIMAIISSTILPPMLEAEDFKNWILKENFKYFFYGIDKNTALPYDHIFVNDEGDYEIGKYTSPTIIGLWAVLLTDILKGDIIFPGFKREKAKELLHRLVLTLEGLPRWQGLFYWYELKDEIKITENEIISAYDNGNLSISLMVIYGALCDSRNALEREIASKIYKILTLQKRGWQKLFDRKKGFLYGGYRKGKPLSNLWIDRFYTEARIAVLVSILIADLPPDIWDNLRKEKNSPRGKYQLSDGTWISFLKPYQGAFQAWFPLLFIPEGKLSPRGLKKAHQNYALIQLDYSLNSKLPLLRSACANPDVKEKYIYEPSVGIFNASEDWVRSDIGSAYATALLYPIYSESALGLLKKTIEKFPQILGPLGFYDAISEDGNVAKVYLALDQLQLILAFLFENNQNYFLRSLQKIGKENLLEELYSKVEF